jgi:hypothetical protein
MLFYDIAFSSNEDLEHMNYAIDSFFLFEEGYLCLSEGNTIGDVIQLDVITSHRWYLMMKA